MIIGIIKNKERLIGDCEIKEITIANNKTKTVICGNKVAISIDKIIFICEKCSVETIMGKRYFFDVNNSECTCRKCRTIRTSLAKYGTESPNQKALIKEKQHLKHKSITIPYEDGNSYTPNKTDSSEERCALKSKNALEKWENGDYDNSDFSTSKKILWATPEYKQKMHDIFNTSNHKKIRSITSINRWKDADYRNKVCKGVKNSINSNKQELKRRSDYMLDRWENDHDKILESLIKNPHNKFSKLHLKIVEQLKLRSLGFVGEQKILRYIVDELNENTQTIIEINGDYIHANPKIFQGSDIIKLYGNSYTAEEKWESDAIKLDNLSRLGYKVIVIWESDDLDGITLKYPEIFLKHLTK